jgi:hypothetical protein
MTAEKLQKLPEAQSGHRDAGNLQPQDWPTDEITSSEIEPRTSTACEKSSTCLTPQSVLEDM